MTMKKGIVSLLAMTAVMTGSYAASADTLKEALAAAYSSNPQLLAQRAALRAVDEGVSRAKSGFLPNVGGNFSYSETRNTQTSAGGPGVADDRSSDGYNIQASQNVFRGFQDRNRLKQAKSNVTVGRAQLLSVEQQVLQEAVAAYMNVVRDTATVELNISNIQVLERQLQASQDRFRVGEVTRTDVAQSEARLEGAKSTLLNSEAALNTSRAQYRRVIGDAPGTLETPSLRPTLPTDLDEAIEQARSNSPGVKVARGNERAAQNSINVAKGALLPSVDLSAQYADNNFSGRNPDTGSTSSSNTAGTSLRVSVTIPLYAGGARYSDIRRAKNIRSQRMIEIHNAERVAQEAAVSAWGNYRAALGRIKSSEASVRANQIALEGVKQEAYVGSRTTLEVLNAEQELLNSRVSLVRAQRDEIVAAYSLVSATGRLTARDIGLGVDVYDQEKYYKEVGATKFIGFGTGDK